MNSAIGKYALFFVGALLFHVAGTWIIPLIDRDEPRFAEASREMMERGDYVVPYFNDDYRFDKPPFTYWAHVVSYRIFGQNEFSARFPSAVAAALTALVLLAWGTRLQGVTPSQPSRSEMTVGNLSFLGFWAATIFTLSLQVAEHAKAAVADMWLVLFVTIAHWAGFELIFAQRSTPNAQRSTPNIIWWLVFYFALALAFLAKGPIGWTPVLTAVLAIFLLRDRSLFRRFKFGRGMLLALALVALWGVPALLRTHGEYFQVGIGRHVVSRSFTAMGGHGAKSFWIYLLLLPFYFVTIFFSFFPWSLKLPWLVKRVREQRDEYDTYLIIGIVIVFVIFSLVTTKLLHYTLPVFPLLALLLARRGLAENRPIAFFRRTAIVFASVVLVLALFATPVVGRFFPSRQLFRQARDDLKPEMKFAALEYKEPSLVWYFRSRVREFMRTWEMRPSAVQPFMEQAGPRFVIVPTTVANALYPTLPPGWKSYSTRGFNAVKGKRSDLTLILKPD